jgi:hypothetical protein
VRVELHNGYLNNEMAGVASFRFLKLYETSGFERTSFERFKMLEMLEFEHRQMSSGHWNHIFQGLPLIPSKNFSKLFITTQIVGAEIFHLLANSVANIGHEVKV